MALHTRKQFSELCGMSGTPELSVYISRGKIIMSGDYVDDQQLQNKDFLMKREAKRNPKPAEPVQKQPKSPPIRIIKDPIIPTPKAPNVQKPDISDAEVGIYDLEKQQKALAIEKIKKENELLDVKIAKAHGESVPTDLIKSLIAQHSKAMSAAFYNAADNLLARFGKKYKVIPDDVAAYRGDIVDIINRATVDSIEDSRAALNEIVNEYSAKRGVGERL